MTWATLQQMIRIVGYAGGSYLFGEAVADGEAFQQALGGVIAIASFGWWAIQERKK